MRLVPLSGETGQVNRARRVLIVSNFYPPHVIGGAEIVAHRQARALHAAGFDIRVMAGRLPCKDLHAGCHDIEVVDGISVDRIAHVSMDPDDDFIRPEMARYFDAVLASFQPDAVHFHNVSGLGAALIRRTRARHVFSVLTLHDYWGVCFKNTRLRNDGTLCSDSDACSVCRPTIRSPQGQLPIRLRRDFVLDCLDSADQILSPSASLAKEYEASGLASPRIEVLSNGIDIDVIEPRPRQKQEVVHFLCASHLGSHKGIPVLLDAAEQLRRDVALRGRWQLTLAGSGQLAKGLKNDLKLRELDGLVDYAGKLSRPELLDQLHRSDAVILASVWPENQPVILMEAIASGAALIATDIGGNPELVRDGVTGLLVRPQDSHALAKAMRRLIESPDELVRMSRANLELRQSFGEGATIARLGSILNETAKRLHQETPLVICAGDPDDLARAALDHAAQARTAHPVRFISHAWADEEHWSRARAFWLMSETTRLSDLESAARRGMPILAPEACAHLMDLVPTLDVYRSLEHWIALLCSATGVSPRRPAHRTDRIRHHIVLQSRDHFSLNLER